MIEVLPLILFSASLCICLILKLNLLIALSMGLVFFSSYALYKKFSFKEVMLMILSGIKNTKDILILFFFIGLLTAMWRACGTVPYIVLNSISLISPKIFYLCAFILCCFVSMLTGTAFGTASTMGFICIVMASALGVNQQIAAGAILSGVFFGDRCSPMSSSAMLVAGMTKTDLFENIKIMLKTSIVPLILSSAIYLFLSLREKTITDSNVDISTYFCNFNLSFIVILPAITIIVLSIFKIKAKYMMAISVFISILLAFFIQKMSILDIFHSLIFGYFSPIGGDAGKLINGGGLLSMVNVSAIVAISSSYFGIFKKTGLIKGFEKAIKKISSKIGRFFAIVIQAIPVCMISCNQSLAIMLSAGLCESLFEENENYRFSIALEDSVIVIAPLIPWSIAGAVPLAALGQKSSSILFAFYLFLLPLCGIINEQIKRIAIKLNKTYKTHV